MPELRIIESEYKLPISYPSKEASGKTGLWRIMKPIVDLEKCVKCFLCELQCPDSTIIVDPEKGPVIDYEYCKGCGVCASVCPRGAIRMVKEGVLGG